MKHTRKSSTLDAEVLYLLLNGEVHTQKDIATKLDVDRKSVYNAIERLRYKFIIHTFRGGRAGGGVYIDEKYLYYGLKRKPA